MDERIDAPDTRSSYARMLERDHYTPNEAATLLGMDDDVIHQAVHRGTLKAKKVGQDIVSIDRGDLVEWLENR